MALVGERRRRESGIGEASEEAVVEGGGGVGEVVEGSEGVEEVGGGGDVGEGGGEELGEEEGGFVREAMEDEAGVDLGELPERVAGVERVEELLLDRSRVWCWQWCCRCLFRDHLLAGMALPLPSSIFFILSLTCLCVL